MTTNTPRDARHPSDFSNSNPNRDAVLAALKDNPDTWAEVSHHASANSAGQIKRRLIRSHPHHLFRVQTEDDRSGTLFAMYPSNAKDASQ